MMFSLPVAEHLGELRDKVEEVAERAGVSALDRLDLRTALAALPWKDRRRLGLVLESVRAGADTPARQTAVGMMLKIAGEVWAATPPPLRSEG
ncbi:MAG TPA: hypothetical protein VHG30_05320 [Microvirga sp.]|jgi:hypothetical protein|nr:hypothetical protein [Microvirga sp.]